MEAKGCSTKPKTASPWYRIFEAYNQVAAGQVAAGQVAAGQVAAGVSNVCVASQIKAAKHA